MLNLSATKIKRPYAYTIDVERKRFNTKLTVMLHMFLEYYIFFYDSYIENHRSVESSRTKTKKVTFYAIYLTCRKMKMNEVKDTKMTVSLSIYLGSLAID